ncbi:sugar phosphate isomerase/epimerase family protein [Rubripirellula reticaptiva]|uniref:sugar phosphate isomerase/epimerase family protein n=1 Tax=Rubripirellula reticaptiva TaxID=2528013 RepID=UPI0016441DC3|nr:sugar phosphate isomerase/epimerase family protein [Rubripirellula reticaptiva]
MKTNRRNFIATSGCAACASAIGSLVAGPLVLPPAAAQDPSESSAARKPRIGVFTKPLNSLSFDELADSMAEAGFDGIEAPVREGGNVEPESVEEDLPRLVEALGKRDLTVMVLTSDINDASDPLTERVLRTAATLGITKYRMQYLKYELNRDIAAQIEAWRPQLRDLAAMNHDFGVQGLYQNHAGNKYFGSSIWDLHIGLDGIDTADISVAYDIRHAIAEGGMSWPVALNLIRPKIGAIYVKDFRWDGNRLVNVPLGEGRVGKEEVGALRLNTFDGPVSLHEEYIDHKDPALVPKHLAAMKSDLNLLRSWIEN